MANSPELIGSTPETQLAEKAPANGKSPDDDAIPAELVDALPTVRQESDRPKSYTVVAEMVSQSFSGPLPSPNILAGYEQVIPGAGDRIMKWAESEQGHRHSQDRWKLRSDIGIQCAGLLFAGTVAIGGTACGTYLIAHGQAWGGGAVVFSTLATIILGVVHAIKVVRADRSDLTQIVVPDPGKPSNGKSKPKPPAQKPRSPKRK